MRYNIDKGGEEMKEFFLNVLAWWLWFVCEYPVWATLVIATLIIVLVWLICSIVKDIREEEKRLEEHDGYL